MDPSSPRESDLLAFVSHELRAPISVILGFADTLRQCRHLLSKEEVDDSLDRISRQAQRAVGLVNDLLDLSQFDSGRLRVVLERVYLAHTVKLALEGAPAPPGTTIELDIPEDVTVIADPTRLTQVVVNLLTNAYRYGGGAIRVEVHGTADGVLATFSDNGNGVPEELVPHLFERFTRGANATGPQSAGLGLAIVLALVEEFGGEVKYETGSEGGASFLLLLRDGGAHDDSRTEGGRRAHDDSGTEGEVRGRGNSVAKILVVDDEPDIRYLLRMAFESAGYEVIEAPHGAAALERVAESRPDLVVTDMMMPVMDGRGLIERLRADPETMSIPILVVSSHAAVTVGDAVLDKAGFRSKKLLETASALMEGSG